MILKNGRSLRPKRPMHASELPATAVARSLRVQDVTTPCVPLIARA